MKKLIILVLLVSSFKALAQQNYKFGKVSKAELEEEIYPLDSIADAAYLYKNRNTYYQLTDDGWQIITEYHERIKIYNKDAFHLATKIVSCYDPESGSGGSSDSVKNIKGYTFNLENGKIVKEKLSNNSIFKERKNKYRVVKKIAMPSVKEGSVIDLKYKIISARPGYVADVHFQYGIPVKKFETSIAIPEFFVFKQKNTGYYAVKMQMSFKNQTLNGDQTFSNNVYKFNDENIPALRNNEPYIGSIRSYRGGMSFELTQTNFISLGGTLKSFSNSWGDVTQQIYNASSFGGELKKQNYYKEDINKLLVNVKSNSEKVAVILTYVKNKVKWNGFYGFSTEKGVKKAYKEQTGNVADINLMLTSMLNYAGLTASPVLVSSKGNGIPIFPTIDGFDYVIAMVEFPDNTYVLLDATEPFSTPNNLPRRVLNWNGRKISKKGGSSWVSLTSKKHATEDNMVMVKINNDLMVEGLFRTKYANYNALAFRKKTNYAKEESLIKKFEEDINIEIDNFSIVNQKKLNKPITRSIKFLSEDLVESINGKLYVEPLLFLSHHENPFKLKERKFPIDFTTPWRDKHLVSIEVPEGYKVESLPESLAIGLPDNLGVFKFLVKQQGNQIKTTCIIEFNEALINSRYYPALKDFYAQRIKKESEKIVLVKI